MNLRRASCYLTLATAAGAIVSATVYVVGTGSRGLGLLSAVLSIAFFVGLATYGVSSYLHEVLVRLGDLEALVQNYGDDRATDAVLAARRHAGGQQGPMPRAVGDDGQNVTQIRR